MTSTIVMCHVIPTCRRLFIAPYRRRARMRPARPSPPQSRHATRYAASTLDDTSIARISARSWPSVASSRRPLAPVAAAGGGTWTETRRTEIPTYEGVM